PRTGTTPAAMSAVIATMPLSAPAPSWTSATLPARPPSADNRPATRSSSAPSDGQVVEVTVRRLRYGRSIDTYRPVELRREPGAEQARFGRRALVLIGRRQPPGDRAPATEVAQQGRERRPYPRVGDDSDRRPRAAERDRVVERQGGRVRDGRDRVRERDLRGEVRVYHAVSEGDDERAVAREVVRARGAVVVDPIWIRGVDPALERRLCVATDDLDRRRRRGRRGALRVDGNGPEGKLPGGRQGVLRG